MPCGPCNLSHTARYRLTERFNPHPDVSIFFWTVELPRLQPTTDLTFWTFWEFSFLFWSRASPLRAFSFSIWDISRVFFFSLTRDARLPIHPTILLSGLTDCLVLLTLTYIVLLCCSMMVLVDRGQLRVRVDGGHCPSDVWQLDGLMHPQ